MSPRKTRRQRWQDWQDWQESHRAEAITAALTVAQWREFTAEADRARQRILGG